MSSATEVVASTLILKGTFLGWDKDSWKSEDGERHSRPVLVFAKESKRFTQAVQVPEALFESVQRTLADAEDRVVGVECFVGNYKALVLIAVLEVI